MSTENLVITREHLPGLLLARTIWDNGGPSLYFPPALQDATDAARAAPPATVVPEGWRLVPERMELLPADIAAIMFHCGGDEDATEVDEMYQGGLLWIGEVQDDDGNKVYGLNIACIECLEEGSTPLVEFATAPAPVQQTEFDDAYQGAREDLAIWKRRALEAEEKLRVYDQRIVGLGVLAMQSAPQIASAAAAPDVAGIARDASHPRAVVLYLRKEPDDCDIRAIQEALREPRQSYMAGAPLLSAAAQDVLAERNRQVNAEGYDTSHDDMATNGQMAVAAGYYALICGWPHERDISLITGGRQPQYWPWAAEYWKPTTSRRNLIKAGALIIAEVERLDRAAAQQAVQVQQP